jgi:hypothetical protein
MITLTVVGLCILELNRISDRDFNVRSKQDLGAAHHSRAHLFCYTGGLKQLLLIWKNRGIYKIKHSSEKALPGAFRNVLPEVQHSTNTVSPTKIALDLRALAPNKSILSLTSQVTNQKMTELAMKLFLQQLVTGPAVIISDNAVFHKASEHIAGTHTMRSSPSRHKRNAAPKPSSRAMSCPPRLAPKKLHRSSRWEASPSSGKRKDSSLSPVRRTGGVKLATPPSRPHPESLVTSGARIDTDHHQRANAVPRGTGRERPAVALIQQAVDIISDFDSISLLC